MAFFSYPSAHQPTSQDILAAISIAGLDKESAGERGLFNRMNRIGVPFPLLVSSVYVLWLPIALNLVRLWTVVKFKQIKAPVRSELTRLWILRSKKAKLDLSISCYRLCGGAPRNHSNRIRSLRLSLSTGDVPALKRVSRYRSPVWNSGAI